MAGSYTYLRFHIVFSTRDRLPLIGQSWREELHQYIGGIIRGERGKLISINSIPNHLHLLASTRADQSIADLVRLIKTNSSGWIHDKWIHRRAFHWQEGYGAFTVSPSSESRVVRYIENQERHHRRKDFKEEFVQFLKAHNIDYDERYIWK